MMITRLGVKVFGLLATGGVSYCEGRIRFTGFWANTLIQVCIIYSEKFSQGCLSSTQPFRESESGEEHNSNGDETSTSFCARGPTNANTTYDKSWFAFLSSLLLSLLFMALCESFGKRFLLLFL